MASGADYWMQVLLIAATTYLVILAKQKDYERKAVFLNYDLDDHARADYVKLLSALECFASNYRMWRITSSERNENTKYHAGAGISVKRKPTTLRAEQPRFLRSTIASFELDLGDQKLYFFPDRVFVYQDGSVGAVHYSELLAESRRTNFVEEGGVPGDSRVVSYTWRYTNKNGGPDRRFANNSQLPVVEYADVFFATQSGVRYALEISNPERAEAFVKSLRTYSVPQASAQPLALRS